MKRICQDCGKPFEGRSDAQFCSDACRIRTRRKQKAVAIQPVRSSPEVAAPAGMVLVAEEELAKLQALAAQLRQAPELGPELRIDYSRLSSYLSDAKQFVREKHPTFFAQNPFDINGMLDTIFGKGHVQRLPGMVFTVNINRTKSALTPDG